MYWEYMFTQATFLMIMFIIFTPFRARQSFYHRSTTFPTDFFRSHPDWLPRLELRGILGGYQQGKLLIVTFCEKASHTADLLHTMNVSSELQWMTKNLLVTSRCVMDK